MQRLFPGDAGLACVQGPPKLDAAVSMAGGQQVAGGTDGMQVTRWKGG